SDSGDYEVEIVDDDITPAMGRVGILSPIKSPAATSSFKPRGSAADLDSILDYASQPLRSSAPTSSAMRPPTDGPMGLKQLNGALMRAMYKQDEEALRAAMTASTAVEIIDESGERDGAGDSGDSESDAGVESDSDSELEDIDSILRPRLKRRPAPVISDDDDDEPVARPPSVTAQKPLLLPTAIASSDKSKKFLGMFKMPAAKPKAKPPVAPVELTPLEPSPPENPMSASQDVPYLFSSQLGGVGDTQDSLLMTPAEDVTNRQFDSLGDTQMGMMGHLEQFPDYQETQPTQMMADDDDEEVGRVQLAQNSQPTQLTMATDSDAGQDDSILPTMVRRALVSGGDDSDASAEEEEDGGEEDEEEEDGDSGIEEKIGGSMSPPPMAPAGRLLRKGDIVAQRRQKRRDAKRSEFVEAEAEEGDSSDSDGVSKGAGPRKFNWGDGPAPIPAGVSDDEEEYDMDSDEEEAALLADPMINNEVDENASEGDEAIRELHRQRDFDDDERNIQTLYNDITTGALKNR
ncbi:hypothetical protein FBU31_006461, partial [Coemansia sp. 'formosensis']